MIVSNKYKIFCWALSNVQDNIFKKAGFLPQIMADINKIYTFFRLYIVGVEYRG
jgi:hypothetical protein